MKRLAVLAIILLVSPFLPADDEIPNHWQTVAERSGFRATSSYDETIAFLRQVQARAPHLIRVTDFGRSGQGRPLPLVIVSSEGAFTPEAAAAVGKPVLLFQSCIHAGEVDGKVASLMILRDIALGRRPDLAEAATLLFAPIYNADGHERVSVFNRPNQNGPVEGTGYRTTASGINLNRDFLRVASPEGRAMARLVSRWRPHLHVDNHVTNGSDHVWVLTWLVPEAPLLPPAIDAWVKGHLPPVIERTEAAGHPSGPYVSLVDGADPSRGMEWDMFEPRYSSNYFPLRNRVSILIEMHAHKPFRDRVLANRDFMAVQLFEPEAPDSLLRWGAISSVFERKMFIGLDVLEKLAREMLTKDEIRIEWQRALENEVFAADRTARYLWWYRRTPYWDDSVGLLPILRVMAAPDPPLATGSGEMRGLDSEPRPQR